MTFDYEADTPSTKALLFVESIQKYHYDTVIIEKTGMCLLSFVFLTEERKRDEKTTIRYHKDSIFVQKS